jgi:3-hydroxyacyl-CoA dehydrogenase
MQTTEQTSLGNSAIRHAAVIGAGTMGAGIAAQFANAGIPVDLLDVVGDDPADRNSPARTGLERQIKIGGLMAAKGPQLVRVGNLEDDFERLAQADWIVEVIVENLAVKKSLYERIAKVRKPGSLVSSNTSTLPRSLLVDGLDSGFAGSFYITHFFNPPRIMQLLEIVSGPENDAAGAQRIARAGEEILGKTLIECRDTPGFIANRIGCTWLAIAVCEAERMGISPETADAVMTAIATPPTGAYGLLDLIGLDLVPLVWGSLMQALPADDAINLNNLPEHPSIQSLLEAGNFGRKTRSGFFRKNELGERETYEVTSDSYRPEKAVSRSDLPGGGKDIHALLNDSGPVGHYAWQVFSELLIYAAKQAPDIAHDPTSIDEAMILGYGWREGPFSLAKRFGFDTLIARLEKEGRDVPDLLNSAAKTGNLPTISTAGEGKNGPPIPRTDFPKVSIFKTESSKILGNETASLWDTGDGIFCFEMHTKMNSFAPEVFDILEGTLDLTGGKMKALVLANDNSKAFSVGADLSYFLGLIEVGEFGAIEKYLERGQRIFLAMKYSPVPVVAAVRGFALGGGCEFALHADTIVTHSEARIGLPEFSVGLIPGWGGCTQLLLNALGAGYSIGTAAERTFETIFSAVRSNSAANAMELGFLKPKDVIVMHADLVLKTALCLAAEALDQYTPQKPVSISTSGIEGQKYLRERIASKELTPHSAYMATCLAKVLTAPTGNKNIQFDETAMMKLERNAVTKLSRTEGTKARMIQMLKSGKPLIN